MEGQRVDFQEEVVKDEQGNEQMVTTYQINGSVTEGKAIAALVLGIVSIVLANMYTFWLALPAGIVGIVIGRKARTLTMDGHKKGNGIATAGFICSIIGVCLSGLVMLLCFWLLVFMLGIGSMPFDFGDFI